MPPRKASAATSGSNAATGKAGTSSNVASGSAFRSGGVKKVDPNIAKAAEERRRVEADRAARVVEDLKEWDSLSRRSWKGLGLTDPIKNVEVGANVHPPLAVVKLKALRC